ncbi:hypothetical protein [Sagittula sp. SSi028]|uniref:hypothetical protein n=1 Tax=Sagittula sp. SSi028 TaxID=3400636 RepID=UPI003AF5E5D3
MPKLKKLRQLVELEHQALIRGEFEKLCDIHQEKQSFLSALSLTNEDAEVIEEVREKMKRNHILFNESLAGMRAVISRMQLKTSTARTTNTYDARGMMVSFNNVPKTSITLRA